MVALPTEAITRSELVTGIVGTVDIGGLIGQSIKLQDDIGRATTKLNEINATLEKYFASANTEAIELAGTDGKAIVSKAKTILPQNMRVIDTLARDSAVQSAGGYGITANVLGQWTKFYSVFNHLDFQTRALIDIPESLALLRVKKYYNKLLAPEEPNERDFTMMVNNGQKTFAEFVVRYQEHEGLSVRDAQNVANIRQWSIGKPSLRDAWLWVQKGYVTKQFFLSVAQWGAGWTKADAERLYTHYFYDFSPMELFRISDLMPTSSTWINKKLDALGLTQEDKIVMANLIQARTLKDEITQSWNILVDNYSWGLETEASLTSFLTDNGVPAIQATAKLVIANALREKVILKLMRDAEIYLYRKDVVNENQLLTNLQSLNISLDVANAITRNEAAKNGIDWEMPA